MKNYGDLGGCYPPPPTASTDNTLLDVHNSSYDTQPHSLIVKIHSNVVRGNIMEAANSDFVTIIMTL